MNYGLYTAASGMLTAMHRMDVYANNLANMETAGFKHDVPASMQREAARVEDGLMSLPSNAMLERLGGGAFSAPVRVSRAQGALRPTGNPLDVALSGNGYLVVREGAGTGVDTLRLTRDGRLARNSEGRLVQATSGLPVLDERDRPIDLPAQGVVDIDNSGAVRVNGGVVARLQVTDVPRSGDLRKHGQNLLTADGAQWTRRVPGTAQVVAGHVEQSTVNAVKTMVDINKAERAIGSAARLIQIQDELMNRAINTFAKVA